MGVQGLWKLLEGTSRPITLESLEGKMLAVDVSIWLNQAIKGIRNVSGQSINDAHLITLFNRICKLLYFGVKPVFVFDGQAPLLKQQALRERRQRKFNQIKEKKSATEKLLQNYLKRQVIQLAKSKECKPNGSDKQSESAEYPALSLPSSSKTFNAISKIKSSEEDLFKLPETKNQSEISLDSSDEEREEQWKKRALTREAVYGAAMSGNFQRMMAIDVTSDDFKSLPPDIQHELLHDIKEIRKRRRTQIEAMPENSESFSNYQLAGLLAKREISERIENVEKQMQQANAITMTDLGLDSQYGISSIDAKKISSEDNTHYILIKGLKQKKTNTSQLSIISEKSGDVEEVTSSTSAKISPSCDWQPGTSKSDKVEPVTEGNNYTPSVKVTTETVVMESLETQSECDSGAAAVDEKISSAKVRESESIVSATWTISDENIKLNRSETENIHVKKGLEAGNKVMTDNHAKLQVNEVILTQPESFKDQNENSKLVVKQMDVAFDEMQNKSNMADSSKPNDVIEDDSMLLSVKINEGSSAFIENTTVPTAYSDSDEEFVDIDLGLSVPDSPDNNNSASKTQSEPTSNPWLGMQVEDLEFLSEQMDVEDTLLLEKIRSSARAAREVSDVATTECQQLLRLFGIPYLVSPQEAEAQCAYLESIGLTRGTITDDSDSWLFGSQLVYRDIFSRKKNPSLYSLVDIKAELGLDRLHFINIALCSGCDYTAGLEGVGPVVALEIMKEFPGVGIESLNKFREWWDSAHMQVKSMIKETKIKSKLRKVDLPSSFPSQMVADAYVKPAVNESKETFSWGIPDLDGIRDFAIERLKWTKGKVDETLLPVLKKMAERSNLQQRVITTYFPRTVPLHRPRKVKSKRVSRAVAPLLGAGVSVTENKTAKKANSKTSAKMVKRKGKKTSPAAVPEKMVKSIVAMLSESSSSDGTD